MATIEERAKALYLWDIHCDDDDVFPISMKNLCRQEIESYTIGATNQDRIAREEERKRCINAFCKIECGRLANETCPNTDSCILDCKKYKSFCKAIEEGGNNGND